MQNKKPIMIGLCAAASMLIVSIIVTANNQDKRPMLTESPMGHPVTHQLQSGAINPISPDQPKQVAGSQPEPQSPELVSTHEDVSDPYGVPTHQQPVMTQVTEQSFRPRDTRPCAQPSNMILHQACALNLSSESAVELVRAALIKSGHPTLNISSVDPVRKPARNGQYDRVRAAMDAASIGSPENSSDIPKETVIIGYRVTVSADTTPIASYFVSKDTGQITDNAN